MSDDPDQTVYTVAYVPSETEVIINAGLKDGVKNGDKILIYKVGPEIIDPESRKSLGTLELVLGQGEVTHAQEHIAAVRSTKKEKMPDRRHIFEDDRVSRSAMSMVRAFSGKTPTSEIISGETVTIPFSNPSIGDKAKKVGS